MRFGVVRGGGIETCGDVVELPGDAVLLGLELIEGDGSGVVGLHELVALVEKVVLLPGEIFALVLGVRVEYRELLADNCLEGAAGVGVELDTGVVVDDESFDSVDLHGLALAVGEL